MSTLTPAIAAWLESFLAKAGKSPAPAAPAPAPAAPVEPEKEESPLAKEIRAALAAGGINIALYMIGDPDSNNDKEFKRQATAWAGNHGAFGLAGGKPKKNQAMSLSADPGKLIDGLLAGLTKELGDATTLTIANLALFSHGGEKSIQVDSQGEGVKEKWASATSKVIKDMVASIQSALTPGAKIHLFACNAAKDRDVGKGADDATRVDSFAEDLAEMTGAEVWGHENAAHATGNTKLVQVKDTNQDENAERYQIRDVLARTFLLHVDSSLTPDQMGYLDQKLKIADGIRASLVFKGEGSKQLDRHQIFIEEISMMGFDRLFDLLIPDTPPADSVFRSLFPEHDQIDKLVEGAAVVHAQFHKKIEPMIQGIAAEKAKPEFPGGQTG